MKAPRREAKLEKTGPVKLEKTAPARPAATIVWPEPTRRAFVTMLGAAAAALALPRPAKVEAPPPPLPRWIGHV